ncbi:hypothetical protein OIU84_007559 [Salix udensis]|uniref:Uncharacterized protein n=1 Tax=Salix udensis TaxID=889485 RepID=A0AAD6JTA8_9ROSI|nr:hypothetical protein OIU84_007559 [Salix udensis]
MTSSFNILSVLALALSICVQGTLGEITCEHLDQDTCAYAISSSGRPALRARKTKSLGISSDSLLESRFAQQLCSPQCYDSCPNVVDLYFNLAAAEGVFLPVLCAAQEGNVRRGLMADIKSSGFVAPGPVNAVKYTYAPAPVEITYTAAPAPVELTYTAAPAPVEITYTAAPAMPPY